MRGIASAILQQLITTPPPREESPQLSDGAIAGIVIVVLFAIILLSVLVVVAIVIVLTKSRRQKYTIDTAGSSAVTENVYTKAVDKFGVPVGDTEEKSEELQQSQVVPMHEKPDSHSVPPTVHVESNPAAVEDGEGLTKAHQESSDPAKDTQM